ncbi:hypothetical protein ACWEK5_45345 [Rhodococcus koreensis]
MRQKVLAPRLVSEDRADGWIVARSGLSDAAYRLKDSASGVAAVSVGGDALPAVVSSLAQQCVVVMEGRDRGSRGVESIGKFGVFASLSAWKGRVPFFLASGRASVAGGDGCVPFGHDLGGPVMVA